MEPGDALGLAGVVLSAIGIPVTYMLARRGRQRPELRYTADFDVLMSPNVGIAREALGIAYEGHNITRVSRTNIALWNNRGDTVRGSDIVDDDPLRIQLPEGDIALQVRMLAYSRPQCQFSASLAESPRRILLKFDFLDAGDGAVMEIIHVGTASAAVEGTVRGASLRSKGRADLTPTALTIVAEKSRRRRIERQVGKEAKGEASSARIRRVTLAVAANYLAMVVIGVFMLISALQHKPELVSPGRFDLATMEGQHRFASEVREEGSKNSELKQSVGIVAIGVLFSILVVATLARAAIPRSIVSVRVFESPQ